MYVSDGGVLLQSGLIWPGTCKAQVDVQPSTPLALRCLAPVTTGAVIVQCSAIVSDIGPYCRKHSIEYENLSVDPSNIDRRMRGLFARTSPYNVVEMRRLAYVEHGACTTAASDSDCSLRSLSKRELAAYTKRQLPIFVRDEVIAGFGGVFHVMLSKNRALIGSNTGKSSYLLEYETKDLLTGEQLFVVVDGCIESSGLARFGNSALRYGRRSLGTEHVNAMIDLLCVALEHGVQVNGWHLASVPCLTATRDIYDGDEIIVDYGTAYWTDEMLENMQPATRNYMTGRTRVKPAFFAAEIISRA
jgi:hypothetical protein